MSTNEDYKKLFHDASKDLILEKAKNEILSVMVDIHESKKNIGEKDELLSILQLYNMNTTKDYQGLMNVFGCEASGGITILDLNTSSLLQIRNITKSTPGSKSDIQIKMNKTDITYNVSIKSNNGSKPSILNHTPRTANVFTDPGILCQYVPSLDVLIAEYICKRNSKIVNEEAPLCMFDCMKEKKIYQDIVHVLLYFVFDGTGKGFSKNRANSVLLINKNLLSFITCSTHEQKEVYIESIIGKCVISLREKGMLTKDKHIQNSWCFQDCTTERIKGSLHVRMKL